MDSKKGCFLRESLLKKEYLLIKYMLACLRKDNNNIDMNTVSIDA